MTANDEPLGGPVDDVDLNLGRPRRPDYTPEPVFREGEFNNLRRLAFEGRVGRMVVEVLPEPLQRLLDQYEALNELRKDLEAFWCVPGEHYVPGDEECPVALGALRACRECMEAGS